MSAVESRERVKADAISRARRTVVQGLLIDVAYAVMGVLIIQVADVEMSRAYWEGLGILVCKTAWQTAAAWAMRHIKPPKTAVQDIEAAAES